jgi:uncharacterized membrane protein YqgA involved in biofilm formation
MLGTILNAVAIVVGSLLGVIFRQGIPGQYKETLLQGVALAVILIGWKSALQAENLLVVILSVVVGALFGEWLRIESRLENLGKWLERRIAAKTGNTQSLARGFVTASLVFCVGSMAIVGSMESGLTGQHQTLFAKSILDGVISMGFASAMGIGVLFSCLAVFVYQGMLTLTAVLLKPFLVPAAITQMTAVGGLLIVAIGLNMLGMVKIRVGNLLPAIFLPLFSHVLHSWLG